MDIVIPKKDLNKLLERCHGVADKKSPVPALANVLLAAEGKSLRVAATDLYLSMTGTADAEVAAEGAIALPAKDLFERVKAMPEGPLRIHVLDGCKAEVSAVGQKRRYTLSGLSADDFPALPAPKPDADALDLPAELLALLMARTHFSISSDETRAHVNSLLVEWSGGRVRAVSTDGHRLTKMEAARGGDGPSASMLISQKAIGELRRFVDGAKGATIGILHSGPIVFFTLGAMTFSAKLIDAQFPPYDQVLPAVLPALARANRVALIEAVKAVQIAAAERTGGIKFHLAAGLLRVTAASPEHGDGEDEVPVEYAGEAVVAGFNAKYVLDVLAALDCDDVEIGIAGELDPMAIRPSGDGADFVAVVMPMRI